MAIAFVQEWPLESNGNASETTTNDGPVTSAGNTIIVRVSTRDLTPDIDTITVTDNGGNTYVEVERTQWGALYYTTNANPTTAVTAAYFDDQEDPVGTVNNFVTVTEWSGIDTSAPLLDSAQYESPDGMDSTAPVTPEVGALVFGMLTVPINTRTFTLQGTEYTQLSEFRGQQQNLLGAWKIADDDTPTGPEWDRTEGSATGSFALTAAFKAGEGGSPTVTVDAGADQSIFTGQTANLTATASGGAGTKTYQWTKISGPAGVFTTPTQASTIFNPTGGVGTYVLRVIVNDDTGSAQDDLTLTVANTPSTTPYVSINDSTGWTPNGGSVVNVLSDNNDATGITSEDNPTAQVLDGVVGSLSAPAEGAAFRARFKVQKLSATTGTLTGKLYVGSSLHSTVSDVPIPNNLGYVTLSFPANDLTGITSGDWSAGVRVVIEATAA